MRRRSRSRDAWAAGGRAPGRSRAAGSWARAARVRNTGGMTPRGVAAPVTAPLRREGTGHQQGAKQERERREPHVREESGQAGPPLGEVDFFQGGGAQDRGRVG